MYWNHLGRQLKLWRSYKVTDAHALKLLKLWLGYEFTDLMDEFGRYSSMYFNEIRRRLGYASWFLLEQDIRRCRSFFLVGTEHTNLDGSKSDTISAIFSPVWHNYEEADGQILMGSCDITQSQTLSQTFDVSIINNTIIKANAINDESFCDEKRTVQVRRQIVKDYFKWLVRQPMLEHRELVSSIRFRLSHPVDKAGRSIKQYELTEEQTNEVWQILVDEVLSDYFQRRQDFFSDMFMSHPEKRIWWLTNHFKKYGKGHLVAATKRWRRNRRSLEAEAAQASEEAQKLHRPRSPHEWEDASGTRWYITSKGTKQQIPPDAEPRPSESSSYNYITGGWINR